VVGRRLPSSLDAGCQWRTPTAQGTRSHHAANIRRTAADAQRIFLATKRTTSDTFGQAGHGPKCEFKTFACDWHDSRVKCCLYAANNGSTHVSAMDIPQMSSAGHVAAKPAWRGTCTGHMCPHARGASRERAICQRLDISVFRCGGWVRRRGQASQPLLASVACGAGGALLALNPAVYFFVNARTESTLGFRVSVVMPGVAAACCVAFAALQLTRWNIVVLAVPGFLGATWTGLARWADRLPKKPVDVAASCARQFRPTPATAAHESPPASQNPTSSAAMGERDGRVR